MKTTKINQLIKEVNAEEVIIPEVIIENDALHKIPYYLRKRVFNNIVIVVDENTKMAAGSKLEKLLLGEDYCVTTIELKANHHNQVIADEQTLIQLLVGTPNHTDVILAVGAGTIHDVVRFAGYKMDIPFISVPTAASVDGFTSKGAPLIFRGFKQTIQTASPLAVFADINIIKKAPQALTAAGFGDIVGKYTSLADWKISSLIANEPYSALAAELTRKSLNTCMNHVQEIASHYEEGLKKLMESLVESGLVMLVLDFSRPASGSEHHLSHYWEMDLLKRDERQLLHGAKVGVSSTIIIDLYKQFSKRLNPKDIPLDHSYREKMTEYWPEIKKMINELPNSDLIRNVLHEVGGPSTIEELGIENQLAEDSLNEAFHLRDRCTGLLLINQLKEERVKLPICL